MSFLVTLILGIIQIVSIVQSVKVQFCGPLTGTHTHDVESFNNKLKMLIKERKGLLPNKRISFINEFLWFEEHGRGNVK